MAMKRGRLSQWDRQYIKDNIDTMDFRAMAAELRRSPETIKFYIEKSLGRKVNLNRVVLYGGSNLVDKPYWPVLQQQFTPEELTAMIYEWDRISEQFHHDVLPTEEMQIIDAIKLELLMNRNLTEQRQATLTIQNCEQELLGTKDEGDKAVIFNLEKQVAVMRAAQGALSKEYRELQDKKNKMLEALKATRAARVQAIEGSKQSFRQWMSTIVNNGELRRELGLRMEKMRLSAVDEKVRLAAYHKYEDGQVDQPLFTPETIIDDA